MNKTLKKTIKLGSLIACATLLFFNFSFNMKSNSNNIDLSAIGGINVANAECISSSFNYGKCSIYSGNCYALKDPYDCDPSLSY